MNINDHEGQPRPRQGDGLMSKPGVALWLEVSVGTIDRYCKEEGLPFIKMGRTVRFDRAHVGRWVDEKSKNRECKDGAVRSGKRK
jgi:excisionase family DNA binding protein